jgi:hypothetical protein
VLAGVGEFASSVGVAVAFPPAEGVLVARPGEFIEQDARYSNNKRLVHNIPNRGFSGTIRGDFLITNESEKDKRVGFLNSADPFFRRVSVDRAEKTAIIPWLPYVCLHS